MRKILRNEPPLVKTTPATISNQRPPSDYKDAVVTAFNNRYKNIFNIDPAKARLISVRQNSFKPWLATVVLGEDIYNVEGKFLTTKQRSTEIERQEFNKGIVEVIRNENDTPFQLWKKAETAAGLEENELEANLLISPNATKVVYKISNNSLNWYGEVVVKLVPST